MNQIYVAVRAAGKSRTVFGSAFGAEHDQNHIPHAIPAVSAWQPKPDKSGPSTSNVRLGDKAVLKLLKYRGSRKVWWQTRENYRSAKAQYGCRSACAYPRYWGSWHSSFHFRLTVKFASGLTRPSLRSLSSGFSSSRQLPRQLRLSGSLNADEQEK